MTKIDIVERIHMNFGYTEIKSVALLESVLTIMKERLEAELG